MTHKRIFSFSFVWIELNSIVYVFFFLILSKANGYTPPNWLTIIGYTFRTAGETIFGKTKEQITFLATKKNDLTKFEAIHINALDRGLTISSHKPLFLFKEEKLYENDDI